MYFPSIKVCISNEIPVQILILCILLQEPLDVVQAAEVKHGAADDLQHMHKQTNILEGFFGRQETEWLGQVLYHLRTF